MAALALVLATLLMTAAALAAPPQPADHLVPPALPVPQRLSHSGYSEPPPESGFMTRVARWFGLGAAAPTSARDQQLSESALSSYAYPKPVQHFDAAGKPCGLCNKYPWVPMMGQQQQQPHQQQQQHPQQQPHPQQQQLLLQFPQHQQLPQQQLIAAWQPQPLAQASQQRPRAVQFPASPQNVFLPISMPLPPLYKAQQFRPLPQQQQQQRLLQQQLPLENVGAHSELRPVPFLPTATPPTAGTAPPTAAQTSSNFEIVQSHQLTDFVTSVEYPATFVQSHSIDLGQALPANHKQQQEQQQEEQDALQPTPDISTVRYQLEDLSSGAVHQHLPASQLLTELGHFAQTTLAPAADNYPAASSQQQQQQEQEQEQQQELELEQEQEQGNLYYSPQYQELPETSTVSAQYEPQLYTTEPPPPAAMELNNHLASRQRETPQRLLDAPINHVAPHAGVVSPPPRPFTRDPAELNYRLGQTTRAPTPTSTYGAIDASGQFAGMSPPGPQQVIIPYTTKQKPRPFEPANWTPSWRPRQQDNDVEHQESKLVSTQTAAPPQGAAGAPHDGAVNTRRTTKYLTKILATNLRELLKRERETKRRPSHGFVDISRLQHNIDGWTEQEYNSLSHRPSTPTIRGRSKHIPSEYLTTTTPATPTATSASAASQRQSKITRGGFELGGSSAVGHTHAGDLSTSINNLEQLHLKRFPAIDDNRLFDYYDPQQRQSFGNRGTTPLPMTTPTSTSTSTTTAAPTAPPTRDAITPLYVRTTAAPMELWKQAKVAILPQTNEKVYVVTPQPRHHSHHTEPAASASQHSPVFQTPAPRFPRVRPTPAAAAAVELMAATPTPATEQLRNYTPDIFGLMGLSAYVPAEPVEIIDGNSKVITIVTSAPTAAALQRPTAKSTISPSPR